MLKGRFERLALKGVLWVVIALVGAFAVFLAGSVWEIKNKERIAWQERENAKERLTDVSKRYDALSESVAHFGSERGLEEEFRKRFPVAREGEEVIVLVNAPEAAVDSETLKPDGWWRLVTDWLGF